MNSCNKQVSITVNTTPCDCTLNWQTTVGIGTCRLRVHGYVDGLIPNCAGASASGAPAWDGTLPNILIFGSEVYKSNDPVSIQGKTIVGNGITLGFSLGIWTLAVNSDAGLAWIGDLVSACPIGVYVNRGIGCDPVLPATITLEGFS